MLTRIIEAIGLKREQVYICNVIKCRPPGNRDPLPDEVATCAPYLTRQLEILKPKVICTLGRHSTFFLTGESAAMKTLRGRVFDYRRIEGDSDVPPGRPLAEPRTEAARLGGRTESPRGTRRGAGVNVTREMQHEVEQGMRVPPQNLEAEQAVLGAMLLEKDAIGRAVEILGPECFYRDSHGKIFEGICSLYERGMPADLIGLSEELRSRSQLEAIGGTAFLSSLQDQVATAAHVEHHCRLVLEKHVMRELIRTGTEIVRKGYEGASSSGELIDTAEQMIFGINDPRMKKGFIAIRSLLPRVITLLEQVFETKRAVTGVPSGFPDLDRYTAGFQASDLIVVAGRPAMGKTSFCLNVAEHAAINMKSAGRDLLARNVARPARAETPRLHEPDPRPSLPDRLHQRERVGESDPGGRCPDRGADLHRRHSGRFDHGDPSQGPAPEERAESGTSDHRLPPARPRLHEGRESAAGNQLRSRDP